MTKTTALYDPAPASDLQREKLRLEVEELSRALADQPRKQELEFNKLALEAASLSATVEGLKRFEPIRVWAPALSLFGSVVVGAATLLYQNYHDHEFRVTEEMVSLTKAVNSNDEGAVSAAQALGLLGRSVESILIVNLSTRHDNTFYENIGQALINSIKYGNDPRMVVHSLLSKIGSVIDEDPKTSDIQKIKRHIDVLRELMRWIHSNQPGIASSLDTEVAKSRSDFLNQLKNETGTPDTVRTMIEDMK